MDGVSSQNCSAAQSAGGVYGRAGATTDVTFTFPHLSSACGALIVGGVVHVTLLALANDNDVFERLLEMRHEDFSRWLNDIDREGSVT